MTLVIRYQRKVVNLHVHYIV